MNNPTTLSPESTSVGVTTAHTVDLGDVLDITSIGALRQMLESALRAKPPRLTLNGVRITRIDGAALQLLASFYREASALGCEIQWSEPSESLQRAAQLLGMPRWIGLHDAGLQ